MLNVTLASINVGAVDEALILVLVVVILIVDADPDELVMVPVLVVKKAALAPDVMDTDCPFKSSPPVLVIEIAPTVADNPDRVMLEGEPPNFTFPAAAVRLIVNAVKAAAPERAITLETPLVEIVPPPIVS